MEPPADDEPLAPMPPNPLPDPTDLTVPPPPTPQMRQLEEATAAERDEVRRLVEAGAASPEDLRLLADKIKVQREREEQVWRAEVKPSLRKSKKRGFTLRDLREEPNTDRTAERKFFAIAGVAVLLVLLVLTMSSAPLVLVVILLAGLLGYAYVIGRNPPADDDPGDGEPDA